MLPPPSTRRNSPGPKAAISPQEQDFAASAEDPKKLAGPKGSNRATEAGFCCLCRRPDETRRAQRQQSHLRSRILLLLSKTLRNSPRPKAAILSRKQDFAASVEDPKKLTKPKGSNHASEARFCCLCRRPDETRQVQRQQYCLASKNLMPLPKTRRSSPSPKAAISSRKQEFAASAEDQMKLTKPKGSNHA